MCDENVLFADCGGGFSQVLSDIKMYQIVQFKHMKFIPQLSPFLKRQEHSIKLNKNRTTKFRGIFHTRYEQMIYMRCFTESQNLVPNL